MLCIVLNVTAIYFHYIVIRMVISMVVTMVITMLLEYLLKLNHHINIPESVVIESAELFLTRNNDITLEGQ